MNIEVKLTRVSQLFDVNAQNPLRENYRRKSGIEEIAQKFWKKWPKDVRFTIYIEQSEKKAENERFEEKEILDAIKEYCNAREELEKKNVRKRHSEFRKTFLLSLLFLF